jgi:hypothetical protein
LNGENILEMLLKIIFDTVNLALERNAINGTLVLIQGGKSATARDKNAGIASEPDRASFFAPGTRDGDSAYVYCLEELDTRGSKKIKNIIPGEIKLYYKFRRNFLDDLNETKREQAEQVFTQIYQYMNERNCAVGYLLTDQELICVRRTTQVRHGLNYGVIDISQSIPISGESHGLNAKLVLWYLHHRYAVRDPHLNILKRTPKPRNWRTLVNRITAERESDRDANRFAPSHARKAIGEKSEGDFFVSSIARRTRSNAKNSERS